MISAMTIDDTTLPMLANELGKVPHLNEKMLVDLINGGDTARDLIHSDKNQGMIGRLFGALDGSNRRRDSIIKEQTQASIEALTSFAFDLTDSMRFTQENLKLVAEKLQDTRSDLLYVAKASRVGIKNLEEKLGELDRKVSLQLTAAKERLNTIEDNIEIDQLTEAWQSGRYYADYPLPAQIAFVIDDLMRGERGQRISANQGSRGYLFDSIINVCRTKDERFTQQLWSLSCDLLPRLSKIEQSRQEILTYGLRMPQISHLHNAMADYVETETNLQLIRVKQLSGDLPELMDLRDLTETLIDESIAA
jgi:predicted nucleic acid-binding protein